MKTVLLLSGGVDSVAVLCHRRPEIDLSVFVNYGQPAAAQEEAAARFVAASQMARLVVARAPLPCSQLSDDGPRVVPYRNLFLLTLAAAHCAATLGGCDRVFIGATAGDQHDYPDCRPDYLDAAGNLLGVAVEAPALRWSRRECLARIPLALRSYVWSCYEGGDAPCGSCASCLQ